MKTINLLPKFDYGKSFLDKEVFELFYLIVCKFKRLFNVHSTTTKTLVICRTKKPTSSKGLTLSLLHPSKCAFFSFVKIVVLTLCF